MGGVGSKKSRITSVPSSKQLINWKSSQCIPLNLPLCSCRKKDTSILKSIAVMSKMMHKNYFVHIQVFSLGTEHNNSFSVSYYCYCALIRFGGPCNYIQSISTALTPTKHGKTYEAENGALILSAARKHHWDANNSEHKCCITHPHSTTTPPSSHLQCCDTEGITG